MSSNRKNGSRMDRRPIVYSTSTVIARQRDSRLAAFRQMAENERLPR